MWEVAAEQEKLISRRLHEIKDRFPDRIGYVGGIGMGWNIHFADAEKNPQADFTREVLLNCIYTGLIFSGPNNHDASLRVMPPLTIPTEALAEGLDIFEAAIAKADAEQPKY